MFLAVFLGAAMAQVALVPDSQTHLCGLRISSRPSGTALFGCPVTPSNCTAFGPGPADVVQNLTTLVHSRLPSPLEFSLHIGDLHGTYFGYGNNAHFASVTIELLMLTRMGNAGFVPSNGPCVISLGGEFTDVSLGAPVTATGTYPDGTARYRLTMALPPARDFTSLTADVRCDAIPSDGHTLVQVTEVLLTRAGAPAYPVIMNPQQCRVPLREMQVPAGNARQFCGMEAIARGPSEWASWDTTTGPWINTVSACSTPVGSCQSMFPEDCAITWLSDAEAESLGGCYDCGNVQLSPPRPSDLGFSCREWETVQIGLETPDSLPSLHIRAALTFADPACVDWLEEDYPDEYFEQIPNGMIINVPGGCILDHVTIFVLYDEDTPETDRGHVELRITNVTLTCGPCSAAALTTNPADPGRVCWETTYEVEGEEDECLECTCRAPPTAAGCGCEYFPTPFLGIPFDEGEVDGLRPLALPATIGAPESLCVRYTDYPPHIAQQFVVPPWIAHFLSFRHSSTFDVNVEVGHIDYDNETSAPLVEATFHLQIFVRAERTGAPMSGFVVETAPGSSVFTWALPDVTATGINGASHRFVVAIPAGLHLLHSDSAGIAFAVTAGIERLPATINGALCFTRVEIETSCSSCGSAPLMYSFISSNENNEHYEETCVPRVFPVLTRGDFDGFDIVEPRSRAWADPTGSSASTRVIYGHLLPGISCAELNIPALAAAIAATAATALNASDITEDSFGISDLITTNTECRFSIRLRRRNQARPILLWLNTTADAVPVLEGMYTLGISSVSATKTVDTAGPPTNTTGDNNGGVNSWVGWLLAGGAFLSALVAVVWCVFSAAPARISPE